MIAFLHQIWMSYVCSKHADLFTGYSYGDITPTVQGSFNGRSKARNAHLMQIYWIWFNMSIIGKIVGIYWVYHPLLKGSSRGFKQLGPSTPRSPPPFSLWVYACQHGMFEWFALKPFAFCFWAIYNDQTAEVTPNGGEKEGILPPKWPKHSG